MKSTIITDPKQVDIIRDDLLSRTFPGRPDKHVFKKRDLPGFGYEVYGIKKDKTEKLVFRLKLSGPPKFRQYVIQYDPDLLDIKIR